MILIIVLDRLPQRELPGTPRAYHRSLRPSRPRAFPKSFSCELEEIYRAFATTITNTHFKAIGAAQDAARMERVVNFYAGLPRGPAPQTKATGLIGRYQARYFSGKNASGVRKY